jgi:hypothetical protein
VSENIFASWSPDKIDAAILQARGQLAQALLAEDRLEEAFLEFHFCITGNEASPYVRYLWLPEFLAAYRERRAVMLECHRGAGKSYFLPIWVLFVIWMNPVGSTQFIRLNNDVALETDKAFVSIIEINPGWKAVAPWLVPDEKRGWSADGRNFWDNRVDYGEWTRKCFADHGTEPNLLCAGITSGSIIGKHPSNGQYFDDIHDIGNTRSAKEMKEIADVVEQNVVPTWTRPGKPPIVGCACTLWDEKDAYHVMLKTGIFRHIKTPIFVYEEDQTILVNGQKIDVHWIKDTPVEEDITGRKIKSLWHAGYPANVIRDLQERNPVYFPKMFLCDLGAAKGRVLKKEWLAEYPADQIQANWPTYIGIDFASTEDKLQKRDTDYFALSIWRAIPGGGAVLVGGTRVRLGSQEAVEKTKAIAKMQSNLSIVGVEKWGKGEVFLNQLLFSSNLPIVPYPLQGAPVKSKGQRFQGGLAPLFTTGRAWVSSVHDDFINQFVEEWISWDGSKTASGHDDCLDAAYWGAMAAQGHLMPKTEEANIPNQNMRSLKRERTRKALSFGDMK